MGCAVANHNATGKKSKHGPELVQRCRAAILNALDVIEAEGETISALLAKEFKANPLKFMELASKFSPKDLNVELNDNRDSAEQFTDDELAGIAKGSSDRTAEAQTSKEAIH